MTTGTGTKLMYSLPIQENHEGTFDIGTPPLV
jgi:hypothetical protein